MTRLEWTICWAAVTTSILAKEILNSFMLSEYSKLKVSDFSDRIVKFLKSVLIKKTLQNEFPGSVTFLKCMELNGFSLPIYLSRLSWYFALFSSVNCVANSHYYRTTLVPLSMRDTNKHMHITH